MKNYCVIKKKKEGEKGFTKKWDNEKNYIITKKFFIQYYHNNHHILSKRKKLKSKN